MWAWATLGHHPGEALLGRMGEAAERQLASFNPQNVANTVWAVAATVRRAPEQDDWEQNHRARKWTP